MKVEVDGERLTRGQLLNVMHLFMIAGLDTVRLVISRSGEVLTMTTIFLTSFSLIYWATASMLRP